jgi:hypothetical protein
LVKQRQPRTPAVQPAEAPQRPALQDVSQFMLLEREVELDHRPRMLEALQGKVNTVADLRLLLLNDNWALLDRLPMVSVA